MSEQNINYQDFDHSTLQMKSFRTRIDLKRMTTMILFVSLIHRFDNQKLYRKGAIGGIVILRTAQEVNFGFP